MLGLDFSLRFDSIGDSLGGKIEEQNTRLPVLTWHVEANFVDTPAALIEDSLGALERL